METFENLKAELDCLKARIEYLETHDELTGLYGRGYMNTFLSGLGKPETGTCMIAVLSVAGLRTVTDGLGYKVGEKLLLRAAKIVEEAFSGCGVVCRWSEDAFLVYASGVTRGEFERRAVQTAGEHRDGEDKLPVWISFGIAASAESDDTLFKTAHRAEKELLAKKLMNYPNSHTDYLDTLKEVLYEKDLESKGHIENMKAIAVRFADYLGLEFEEKNHLLAVCELHDIGKIAVPENLLMKPGALTDEERCEVQKHTTIGYGLIAAAGLPETIANCVLCHHERYDGSGYPNNLKMRQIPRIARIVSIVDAYDVMERGRVYEAPRERKQALEEIRMAAGGQFDPELAEEFIGLMSDKEGLNGEPSHRSAAVEKETGENP